MKYKNCFALLWLFSALTASAQTVGFTNVVNTAIPDANPTGLSSTMNVTGVNGTIENVSLYLNIAGGWNGDLYAYLSSSNGGFAVLLNRVGKTASNPTGYGDDGFDVLFDDKASTDVHLYGGNAGNPLTGPWQPDGRNVDPQLVLDTDSRTARLSSFNSLDPNTTWTLFVADMALGYNSTLVQWGLEFQVPEPNPGAIALAGIAVLLAASKFFRLTARR